jgi:hypothetical protein
LLVLGRWFLWRLGHGFGLWWWRFWYRLGLQGFKALRFGNYFLLPPKAFLLSPLFFFYLFALLFQGVHLKDANCGFAHPFMLGPCRLESFIMTELGISFVGEEVNREWAARARGDVAAAIGNWRGRHIVSCMILIVGLGASRTARVSECS